MALTRAQIDVLRYALADSVYEADGITLHAWMPFKGAPGRAVIKALKRKGFLGENGRATEAGRGALLTSPEASSERRSDDAL
jgi:hypothetical protein